MHLHGIDEPAGTQTTASEIVLCVQWLVAGDGDVSSVESSGKGGEAGDSLQHARFTAQMMSVLYSEALGSRR